MDMWHPALTDDCHSALVAFMTLLCIQCVVPLRHHSTRVTTCTCRWMKPHADKLAAQHPGRRHPRLGFLSVISFPHLYAASFGEFGSASCRHWTMRLVDAGMPVRCCILDAFSFAHGTG